MDIKDPDSVDDALDKPGKDASDTLFTFDLPPVTAGGGGYIEVETPPDESAPENIEHVSSVQNSGGKPWEACEKYRGQLSDAGQVFDPELHQNPPSQTKTGNWRNKSKAQRTLHGLEGGNGLDDTAAPTTPPNRIEAQKAAQLYAGLHIPILGNAAAPDSIESLLPLIGSIERYYNEKGVKHLPAGLDVLLSMGIYSAQVVNRPEVKPRAARIWDAFITYEIKIKGYKLWGWKTTDKKEPENAHNDSGK
jgi:hypothetical protein